MPNSSKQADRRKIAKLRAELHSAPWSIDVRTLGLLSNAIETGDLETVKATLALGQDSSDSIAKLVNGVAIIPVTGVLRDGVDFMVRWGMASSYQQIERDFAQAIGNSQIKGVLFYFDTPGGSAIGCKRVADLIFESRGEKPIRGYVQGMCGSAGFYMAAACDRIEATADSLVGSIGTIYPHMEMSGLLKELGYGATVFTNAESPKKGHGNSYEPLTPEAKKTLQSYVDSYGKPFINDVARYRGITPEDVVAKYGQGDAIRADVAINQGVIDAVVEGFNESLDSITNAAGRVPSATPHRLPGNTGDVTRRSAMNERIKAQLFALGLISSLSASEEVCNVALNAWFVARKQIAPTNEKETLALLQQSINAADPEDTDMTDMEDDDENDKKKSKSKTSKTAPVDEQSEARLADLNASAELINEAVGYKAITAEMILDAATKKLSARTVMAEWKTTLAESESPVPTSRVRIKSEGTERYAADVVDALVYRASNGRAKDGSALKISEDAMNLVNRPLWAVAGECLKGAGHQIDMYGSRELLAEQAMAMGTPGSRHTFFSVHEGRQYVQATGTPMARPGDFPNILSSLANKFLDTIELDQDYSYSKVSALLPGGLNDFKPGLMINKGIVEELDEIQDAEAFKELGLSEEVLSYLFVRRFGNKWGWTPVMLANDDLGAFVEGMLGLDEAWQVTQNRQVVDVFTSNPTLLDSNALFSDRANTGTGTNPALYNNDRTSGGVPSDTEWAAMETLYADVGGIATGRRVRGTLDTIYVPPGTPSQEARRTFMPLAVGGLEPKAAATTANVGIYRNTVNIVVESELRVSSTTKYYGLRSPTKLNTATVVRGYFNGFGEAGKRERWYDPETKTTWVSIEGRIAVAAKNWRYAIRNNGA